MPEYLVGGQPDRVLDTLGFQIFVDPGMAKAACERQAMARNAGATCAPSSRPMIEPRGASVAGRETLAEAPGVPPSLTRSVACRAPASDSTHRTAQSN